MGSVTQQLLDVVSRRKAFNNGETRKHPRVTSDLLTAAATIISEQAEKIERLNERCTQHEGQVKWGSETIARLQSIISELEAERDTWAAQALKEDDCRKSWEARALAAESSLHRVRAETVEECAKIAEGAAPIARGNFFEARRKQTAKIATAIRSLTNKTGENDAERGSTQKDGSR